MGLRRGCVFGADHDTSFDFWVEDPKWKRCLLFNLLPPAENDDAHYFLATASGVNYFRENPLLLSDVLILPASSYSFFPRETAIDFRNLCVAPMRKLRHMNLRELGELRAGDVARCAEIAGKAMQLTNRSKKLLGLR